MYRHATLNKATLACGKHWSPIRNASPTSPRRSTSPGDAAKLERRRRLREAHPLGSRVVVTNVTRGLHQTPPSNLRAAALAAGQAKEDGEQQHQTESLVDMKGARDEDEDEHDIDYVFVYPPTKNGAS